MSRYTFLALALLLTSPIHAMDDSNETKLMGLVSHDIIKKTVTAYHDKPAENGFFIRTTVTALIHGENPVFVTETRITNHEGVEFGGMSNPHVVQFLQARISAYLKRRAAFDAILPLIFF